MHATTDSFQGSECYYTSRQSSTNEQFIKLYSLLALFFFHELTKCCECRTHARTLQHPKCIGTIATSTSSQLTHSEYTPKSICDNFDVGIGSIISIMLSVRFYLFFTLFCLFIQMESLLSLQPNEYIHLNAKYFVLFLYIQLFSSKLNSIFSLCE